VTDIFPREVPEVLPPASDSMSVADLERFSTLCGDLTDEEVSTQAWH